MHFISRYRYAGPLICVLILICSCGKSRSDLPENILGYKRTRLVSGADAMMQVNRLHQKKVTSRENKIGHYSKDNNNALIYVTIYENDSLALREERAMTQKISPDNSPFIMGKYLTIKNKPVYRCFGMGQTHFVFSDQNRLYWLSVETITADNFLDAFLNFLD